MRILVTGGAGFIGSHVADKYIELGHQVTVLDNLSTGRREFVPASADFIEGDITNADLVAELFEKQRFDVVNHHAAQIDVRFSTRDPVADARVNILGTLNLLGAGAKNGLKKFLFASTGGAIYGEQEAFPADESHPTNPASPYGVSKLACEKYIQFYSREYGTSCALMRYANVYGPRQNPHGEAGVVAIFSNLLIKGQPVTIHGDGLQTRDYVYVGDVVEVNVKALQYDGSIIFNVGTGIETDVVTIYKQLAAAAKTDLEPVHGPAKAGEQRRSVISSTFAADQLGWKPVANLDEGLESTYLSFADNW